MFSLSVVIWCHTQKHDIPGPCNLEGTSGGLYSYLLLKAGQLWDQTRLPRVLFNQFSKTPKDEDCTTFLKPPVRVPDCLQEEKCSSYMQGDCLLFKFTVTMSYPAALPHCDEMTSFFLQQGVLLLGSFKFSSSPGWTSSIPPQANWLPAEHTPVSQYLYWAEGHKTDSLMTSEERGITIPLHLLTMLAQPRLPLAGLLSGHTAGSCPTCYQATSP